MPIYEYACGKCDHEFEVEQRISDDPVKTCPACRSRRVKRLISMTSFTLKGGGWYSDGYSSSSDGKSSGESSGEKSSDAKSDAGSKSGSDTSKDSAAGSKSATAKSSSKDAA